MVFTDDNSLAGTSHAVYLEVYQWTNVTKEYDFTINFTTADNRPYFTNTSAIGPFVVNCGYSLDMQMPNATDIEGDAFYYLMHQPSNGFSDSQINDTIIRVSSIDCTYDPGDYTYKFEVVQNDTNGLYGTNITFGLTVNDLPVVSSTLTLFLENEHSIQ